MSPLLPSWLHTTLVEDLTKWSLLSPVCRIPVAGEQEIVDSNMECSEKDIYKITRYDFDWRHVGRRLISDQKTRDIDREGGSERDKREKMLLEWKRTKACDATYRALVKVLRDLENNATADRVEELERTTSTT